MFASAASGNLEFDLTSYVCDLTSATIAVRMASGKVTHDLMTNCNSVSIDAKSSQLESPACSAFAARRVSQFTQLQGKLQVAPNSLSASNPVAPFHVKSAAGTRSRLPTERAWKD